MIDLSQTRAALLADLEATSAAEPLYDITGIFNGDTRVRICGRTKDDFFPLLKLVLCERVALVPRTRLHRDLLIPLRNALGNAQKHGNGDDMTKVISVELVLT